MIDEVALKQQIREQGLSLGFVRVGFARAGGLAHQAFFQHWVDSGYAGTMDYLTRTRQMRADATTLLADAQTMVVCVAQYATQHSRQNAADATPPAIGTGRIARYARGADYHVVLRHRLEALAQFIEQQVGHPISHRPVVDSAPLLEREAAAAAGVGFFGKNTLLISPGVGSYTFIATLLVALNLPPDEPIRPRCGTCRRCLDACPTNAFTAPYTLDARQCISYLTIEHKGEIDPALQDKMENWVFGCDVCQQVCPFNHVAARNLVTAGDIANATTAVPNEPEIVDLADLRKLKSGAYRRFTHGRALARASRSKWIRNAVVATGNQPTHTPIDLQDLYAIGRSDADSSVASAAKHAANKIQKSK